MSHGSRHIHLQLVCTTFCLWLIHITIFINANIYRGPKIVKNVEKGQIISTLGRYFRGLEEAVAVNRGSARIGKWF